MVSVLISLAVPLAAVGLIAVVWAARGGPRWVRGIAKVTTVTADLVMASSKRSRRSGSSSGADIGGGDA